MHISGLILTVRLGELTLSIPYTAGPKAHYKVTAQWRKTGPRWTYGQQSRAATVKVILLSNPSLTTAARVSSNLLFGL